MFDLILQAGGLVASATSSGATVLHTVSSVVPEGAHDGWEQHVAMIREVAERVLAAGGDVHALDNAGRSPLHIAAADGQVALHLGYCCIIEHELCMYKVGVAALLMGARADPTLCDLKGRTPAQTAILARELKTLRWPKQIECCEQIAELCAVTDE